MVVGEIVKESSASVVQQQHQQQHKLQPTTAVSEIDQLSSNEHFSKDRMNNQQFEEKILDIECLHQNDKSEDTIEESVKIENLIDTPAPAVRPTTLALERTTSICSDFLSPMSPVGQQVMKF